MMLANSDPAHASDAVVVLKRQLHARCVLPDASFSLQSWGLAL
jgi:hypothetical protein